MTIGGAIAELQNLINTDDVPFYYKGGIEKVIETISMEIPTTEQSSKVGEWHRVSADKYAQHAYHHYRCSECGEDTIGKPNYCPNCGADMRGSEE